MRAIVALILLLAGWRAPPEPPAPLLFHSPHDVVDSFAMSPDFEHDKTLFLSMSRFNLLLRTRDGGRTFEPIGGGLDNRSVSWLAISPDYGHDHTTWCAELRGLFVSHDRGDFWLKVPTPPAMRNTVALAASPAYAQDGVLAVGTQHDGLWMSHDRGQTWELVSLPGKAVPGRMAPVELLAFSPSFADDGKMLVVVGGDTLLFSSDGGATFVPMTVPGARVQTIVLAEDFGSSGRLWAGTQGLGVWRSDDSGHSWQEEGAVTAKMDVLHLARAPDKDGDLLFASTAADGVQMKRDGADWTADNAGFRGQTHQTTLHNTGTMPSPAFARDHTVFAAAFEGLHVSRQGGGAWEWISVLHPQIVRNLALSPRFAQDKSLWLSTYGAGLLASTDGGKSFRTLNTSDWVFPDGVAVSPDFADDRTLMVGVPNFVLISTDGGRTVSKAETDAKGFPRFLAFAPDYKQSGIAFAFFNNEESSKDRFLRTANKGGWWINTNVGTVSDLAFASDWKRSGRAWAASTTGLFRSDDRGQTFARVESLDAPGISSVTLAAGADGDTLMATSVMSGVHVSHDGGTTWTLLTMGMPPVRPSRVRMSPDFAHDGTAFAGAANDTVFVTRNGGRTWSRVTAGPRVVMSMEISQTFPVDHTVLVGSYDGPWITNDAGATWRPLTIPLPAEMPTSREGVVAPSGTPAQPAGQPPAAPPKAGAAPPR